MEFCCLLVIATTVRRRKLDSRETKSFPGIHGPKLPVAGFILGHDKSSWRRKMFPQAAETRRKCIAPQRIPLRGRRMRVSYMSGQLSIQSAQLSLAGFRLSTTVGGARKVSGAFAGIVSPGLMSGTTLRKVSQTSTWTLAE